MMMYGTLCTEFYDADKKFATSDEINFYKSIFDKNTLLLEPMCGSGRLLIPLMQEGYTIHGIDSSSHMLKSCQERASKFGLTPILFEEKIEDIALPHQYDGIIIPFGSFQLFYPRMLAFQMLEKFKSFLKPNGKLMMDLFVPWDALWQNNEEEKSQREITIEDGSIIKIDNHSTANKYEQFILGKSTYTKWVDGNVVAKEQEQMYICWYYHYEMELILEKYGYKNIQYQERFQNNENLMTFIAMRTN
jgi:2-polyprenyl-3-methyl-5-hydroxy-6-metoxy-1,4-benzoquinol methylase